MGEERATYVPWAYPSPLLDALGSFLQHSTDPLRIGFTVEGNKVNARGFLHAGAIIAIADVAIGHALAATTDPPTPLVTINLSRDFLGTAGLGEWVEGHITLNRMGRRLAATCRGLPPGLHGPEMTSSYTSDGDRGAHNRQGSGRMAGTPLCPVFTLSARRPRDAC